MVGTHEDDDASYGLAVQQARSKSGRILLPLTDVEHNARQILLEKFRPYTQLAVQPIEEALRSPEGKTVLGAVAEDPAAANYVAFQVVPLILARPYSSPGSYVSAPSMVKATATLVERLQRKITGM